MLLSNIWFGYLLLDKRLSSPLSYLLALHQNFSGCASNANQNILKPKYLSSFFAGFQVASSVKAKRQTLPVLNYRMGTFLSKNPKYPKSSRMMMIHYYCHYVNEWYFTVVICIYFQYYWYLCLRIMKLIISIELLLSIDSVGKFLWQSRFIEHSQVIRIKFDQFAHSV